METSTVAAFNLATGEMETINTLEYKAYEIYVTNKQGVKGWDIKLVWSTPERIKSYPLFDCIITINDCTPDHVW